MQGPTFDVLPEGRKTLEGFVERNLPLRNLRAERFAKLPVPARMLHGEPCWGNKIVSHRIHDKDNFTFVRFEVLLRSMRFGPVTANSTVYSGRCDSEIAKLAPAWWKKFAAFANPIADSDRDFYEKLTDSEYQQLCDLLTEGVKTKVIA